MAVVLLITCNSFAQQGTVSPYSFYGMCTTNYKETADTRAMAGLRLSSYSNQLNIQNTASIAELELVNYTVGINYQRANQKVSSKTHTATTTTFDYLAMGIPINKFGVSFGLLPSTSVGYDLTSSNDDNYME